MFGGLHQGGLRGCSKRLESTMVDSVWADIAFVDIQNVLRRYRCLSTDIVRRCDLLVSSHMPLPKLRPFPRQRTSVCLISSFFRSAPCGRPLLPLFSNIRQTTFHVARLTRHENRPERQPRFEPWSWEAIIVENARESVVSPVVPLSPD